MLMRPKVEEMVDSCTGVGSFSTFVGGIGKSVFYFEFILWTKAKQGIGRYDFHIIMLNTQ